MSRPYAVHYLYEYFHEHRGAGKFNAIVMILKYTYLNRFRDFLQGKDTAKMHFCGNCILGIRSPLVINRVAEIGKSKGYRDYSL